MLENYQSFGGIHPETAAVKNVLAYHGVKAPHTGEPFSEAMLFGICGGVGMCYILWEFKREGRTEPILVLAFCNKSNYPVKRLTNLCNRLNAKLTVKETSGKKLAEKHLAEALDRGQPAIAVVSESHLPYLYNSSDDELCYGKHLTIIDLNETRAIVDDLGEKPFSISREALTLARNVVPSYKNRLFLIEPPQSFDLEPAIRAGIQDCVDYLSAKSDSFSLPAIKKWARMMTDGKNKKSWPNVFQNPGDLYSNLLGVYLGIKYYGTDGAALRELYADFLDESDSVISNSILSEAAVAYRESAALWQNFAELAFPDKYFSQTKKIFAEKDEIYKEQGDVGVQSMLELDKKLSALAKKFRSNFPMNQGEINGLFENMASSLERILEAEQTALATLKSCLQG